MWQGKKKAVTFSFDDGLREDIQAIQIFNDYGLKGTFNLNSGLLGTRRSCLDTVGKTMEQVIVPEDKVAQIYKGHEIAVHTLTHPNLTTLTEEEIVREVEEDRKKLEEICGYSVVGMAYPCGGYDHDARVMDIIRNKTAIKYVRANNPTHSFAFSYSDLLDFHPTVFDMNENLEKMVDDFLSIEANEPQIMMIFGHALDFYDSSGNFPDWKTFERICKKLSNKNHFFYGTCKEILGVDY